MMSGEGYAIIALCLLAVAWIPLAYFVPVRVAGRHKNQSDHPTRADVNELAGLLLAAAGILFLVYWGVGRGQFWILEAPMKLAIGWVLFLDRAERNVEPDAMSVVSAVACVVGTAIGAHLFLRWIAATSSRPWPAKWTLQVLLLLALMFASGLAVVGLVQQTSWLIRTPEPLVKDKRLIS